MKLGKKFIAIALSSIAAIGLCVGLTACSPAETPKVVDTYQSQTFLKFYHVVDTNHYFVAQTYTVDLYSDNTYVCDINVSECYQKLDGFEYGQVDVMNPLAVTTFTRFGTYELNVNDEEGTFSMVLNPCTRLIYATNAGGGHYPLVPENKVVYVDSEDEEATAAFETEWFGTWSELEALVGAKVTLTGNSTTHMFDKGADNQIFEYKTPMWHTLGHEVY